MTRADIFKLLQGSWIFTRRITGINAATVSGRATFSKTQDNELLYQEEGTVEISGKTHNCHQQYYYHLNAHQGLSVFFSDKRLFHHINLSGTAEHLCGHDTYKTQYFFEGLPNEFSIQHDVKGPHKDDVHRTHLVASF
jgi:hypothetical protein